MTLSRTDHGARLGVARSQLLWSCAALTLVLALAAALQPPTSARVAQQAGHSTDTAPASSPERRGYRVAICGHLYGLYAGNKIEDRTVPIYTDRYLRVFANELASLKPDATFFLGDSSRYGTQEEWDLLQSTMSEVPGELRWVAGNHEVRNFSTFEAAGGVHNASLVLGRNKFVMLDTKTVFEDEDLEFIERELADWSEYDNVFIMMHLLLNRLDDPEPGVDPYEAYAGGSNWNSRVLPLIAGKVRYVFVGDYYSLHTGRDVQRYGDHEVEYIQNAFLFRRGRGDDVTGDGPMIYLVLEFDEAGEFSLLPRVLPVDLRDSWYRSFSWTTKAPVQEDFEQEHAVIPEWRRFPFRHGMSASFPPKWRMSRGGNKLLYTALQDRDGYGIQARLFSYPNDEGWNAEELRDDILEFARKSRGMPLNIEREGEFELDDGTPVHWIISESVTGEETTLSLNGYFFHKDRWFLAVYSTNEPLLDYRARLDSLRLMFDLLRQHRVENK